MSFVPDLRFHSCTICQELLHGFLGLNSGHDHEASTLQTERFLSSIGLLVMTHSDKCTENVDFHTTLW